MAVVSQPRAAVTTYQIIKQQLIKRFHLLIVLVVLVLISTAVSIYSPLLYKLLIDSAIPARNVTQIIWILIAMLVVPLLATGLIALQDFLRANIGEIVSQSLRQELFDVVSESYLLDYERYKSGDILFRMTRSCGELGAVYVANQLLPIIANGIAFIGNTTVMFALNWRLALAASVAFPASYLFSQWVKARARIEDKKLLDELESGSSYLQEFLAGLRTVKVFNGHKRETAIWHSWNRRHGEAKTRSAVLHNFALTLPTTLINNLVAGLIFGYGAYEIIHSRMSIGALVAFVIYIPRAYTAFQSLLTAQLNTEQAKVSAQKVDQLLQMQQDRHFGDGLSMVESEGVEIAFHGVSFHYGRENFGLSDVNFRVAPGEFIGIVGASGSGKSTIIDLIAGLYTPHAGSVTLNGCELENLSLKALRYIVGVVPQDIFLWNASIFTNLTYPDTQMSRDDVITVTKLLHVHDFIESLPNGYDTTVGDRGVQLSGGERQRLAICRAVLRQPRVLLMDEYTAALDALTEVKVRDAIKNAALGRTTIVVAHRLASVIDADRIIVLSNGRILESGTVPSLIEKRGAFYDLYMAQKL